jgi:glycosyltransferase involved in cell wall biosynthesis
VTEVRVVACFGGMVIVSGMERMSFEVLRVLKDNGAAVHCILNSWENHRIRKLVESIGASWSTGYYWYRFDRHTRNPWKILQMVWDILMTSAGLLRDAFRFRATHVFLPEHVSVLRNAPALLILRALGVAVVLRLANAPERGRFYDFLWRRVLPRLVTVMIANSEFTRSRCFDAKIHPRKVQLIRNRVARRNGLSPSDHDLLSLVRQSRTLLVVGQIAPFKGTHFAVEAVLRLAERGANVQLAVIGDLPQWPPETVEYVRAIREGTLKHPFGERIHLVGPCEDVLSIMSESFLLLAPIVGEESFGNVVLEARSVGLPVVTFARGGLPELVEDRRSGYVCRSPDLEGLLAGIEFFRKTPLHGQARANSAFKP